MSWNDPDQCYTDKWGNEVYPTEKTLRVGRSIRSIDNDIGHAIASLECAVEQIDSDIPDNKDWDAWRTAYLLEIRNALNILEDLSKISVDITASVMWEMVQNPKWFEPRKEEELSYR